MTGFREDSPEFSEGVDFDVISTVGSTTSGKHTAPEGTTVGEWFDKFLDGKSSSNYVISVNDNDRVSRDYVLQANDEIVVTQSKIAAG